MKNYVQNGKNITIKAAKRVSSGDLVVMGALHGVAVHDAQEKEELTICRQGVFDLPKAEGESIAVGDEVYYGKDGITKVKEKNVRVGVCVGEDGGVTRVLVP